MENKSPIWWVGCCYEKDKGCGVTDGASNLGFRTNEGSNFRQVT